MEGGYEKIREDEKNEEIPIAGSDVWVYKGDIPDILTDDNKYIINVFLFWKSTGILPIDKGFLEWPVHLYDAFYTLNNEYNKYLEYSKDKSSGNR